MGLDEAMLRKVEEEGKRQRLLKWLSEGMTDDEIAASLGMEKAEFWEWKKRALKDEAEALRLKPVEEVYAEYLAAQRGIMEELGRVARKFDRAKHYTATVAALKAKSEILDRVIKTGQDFGILEKRAERKEVVAGVLVAKMDEEQLRGAIAGELARMGALLGEYGGRSMAEVETGELHRALPGESVLDGVLKLPEPAAGHKSKANRLYGGRRVSKVKKEE